MRARPEFWRRKRDDGTRGVVLWTNLGGKRVSTGQTSIANAKRWKERRLYERADPRRAAAEAARLDDAIREMYAELRRRGRSAGTLERAKQKLAHFSRLWGPDCKLAAIDASKVDSFVDARLGEEGIRKGEPTSRLTIRDERAFLRQLLRLAKRQGKYAHDIDDVIPRFETAARPKKDFVREDKLEALLDHVIPRHAAHLLFFIITAGRRADAARARREDVDLATWRVTVRGSKTVGSWRTIPISDFLRPFAVRMLRDAEDLQGGPLFAPWANLNRDLRMACDRAGIPRVSTNGLRRTFGKMHRLRGISLDTVSKLFGHTTAKLVRDVYADVEGDELADLMERERR